MCHYLLFFMEDDCIVAEKENYEVLKTEVAHIKERLKEQAEDRKIMLETQKTTSESLIRLTTVVENQEKNLVETKNLFTTEIAGLRNEFQQVNQSQTKWLQNLLEGTFGKTLKILVLIILLLLGAEIAGVDITKLANL
ncbi:hypothetical protein KS08_11085 [Bacillus subtilis]|nr:hypothetical protein BAMTA208_06020 [Bacillus amyloliquefaciens TA208]AIW34156.1 hypothetical protein KS08_11085 [Bacillus subtilis]